MNAIYFGLKRAYQSTLRITRPWLKRMGLTAARFDMLTVIRRHPCVGVQQSKLRQWLGVTAPTISRMLRSLRALGLVARERSRSDRRTYDLTLTEAGLALIRRATRVLIDWGTVQLAVDCALAGTRCHDEDACFRAMAEADWVLRRIRNAFYDRADLYYAWHPDD